MPFTPTNDLAANPAVRVFFTGQLILAPAADNSTCEVFVNSRTLDHQLTIEVRRKRVGKPDIIVVRRLGPLGFLGDLGSSPRHGFKIQVRGGAGDPKGVKTYAGPVAGGPPPSTEGTKLSDSFNLTTLHQPTPLGRLDLLGSIPSILLDDATFYTADKIVMDATLKKKIGGGAGTTLTTVPCIIGANIYLTGNSKVVLSWSQYGNDISLPLSPLATYEIYIDNDPLFEDDSPSAPFRHDEFDQYYKLLPDLPLTAQFKLEFTGVPPERGSTRTPCMPVILNE